MSLGYVVLANGPLTQRYAFRPDVVATLLDDGAVLLDLESKFFYRLNRTGWAIAQLFESGASLADVDAYCQGLGAESSDEVAIAEVIQTLSRDRLIEPSNDVAERVDGESHVPAGPWLSPTIEKQAEPLQRVIISAFDPSVPLVE